MSLKLLYLEQLTEIETWMQTPDMPLVPDIIDRLMTTVSQAKQ
jgi:hypothetical protein